ncbi:MAG: TMEM175 family protein [Chloroflexota bacterium]
MTEQPSVPAEATGASPATEDAPDLVTRRGDIGRRLRTNRLEAFSDGVFAIAITLLVLEIGTSDVAAGGLWQAVADQWPSYLAYLVSFASIGAAWLAHSAMTEFIDRVDATFLRINLLLLLVVAFLPYPTRLLAEHIGSDQDERVAVTLYGLTLLVTSLLISILWRWAARERLIQPGYDDEDVRLLTQRLTPGIGGYVVLVLVGQWRPLVAVVGFLVIAFFFLIPFPLRERRADRERSQRRRDSRRDTAR